MSAEALALRHPVVEPARVILGAIDLEIDPLAILVMARGLRYVDADGDDFGGFDTAFDLFETAGFNCEQFRSVDRNQFLTAARREYEVTGRRWRPLPMWSLQCTPSGTPIPVALSDFSADAVRIRSVDGDQTIGFDALFARPMEVWGYAAPVPSLRTVISPASFDVRERASRALWVLRHRATIAQDGLPRLEAFVDSKPSREALERCRRHMLLLTGGDHEFTRGLFAVAIERYWGAVPARHDFARSAELHAAFLGGDDVALVEIARVERRGFEAARWAVQEAAA